MARQVCWIDATNFMYLMTMQRIVNFYFPRRLKNSCAVIYIHFLYPCHPTHLTLSFILLLSFPIEFGLYCPTTFDLLEFISLKQMDSFEMSQIWTASYIVIEFCAPTSMMGFLLVLGLYQSSAYYHTIMISLISCATVLLWTENMTSLKLSITFVSYGLSVLSSEKILFSKTLYTWVLEHQENKLEVIWACWLAFIMTLFSHHTMVSVHQVILSPLLKEY